MQLFCDEWRTVSDLCSLKSNNSRNHWINLQLVLFSFLPAPFIQIGRLFAAPLVEPCCFADAGREPPLYFYMLHHTECFAALCGGEQTGWRRVEVLLYHCPSLLFREALSLFSSAIVCIIPWLGHLCTNTIHTVLSMTNVVHEQSLSMSFLVSSAFLICSY